MKTIVCVAALAACLIVFLGGCEMIDQNKDVINVATRTVADDDGRPGTTTPSPTTSTPTATRTETPTPTTATPSPTIPPGSLALFATKSGGSQSDFIRVTGGNVRWDTTHYKFLRYIPEAQMLDEFGWTSSKSYSKSYIYGITAGDWVYVVKCFTDSGRKDITRLDPATGNTVGTFAPITTSDMYRGFTIHGDMVIYRTKVSKDLLGNRQGGGDVMVMELGTTRAVEMLDYYDEDNMGRYYSIGNDLVSIVTTYEDGAVFYDIYRVDPGTFAIGELLYSFGSEDNVDFYEGADSLLWTETDPATGNINIIRFPLDEYPMYYLEISETTPLNLSIDESQGKVLVSFRDNTPESPFYYLSDTASGDIIELDVDPAFFSKSKYGNGQFIILD